MKKSALILLAFVLILMTGCTQKAAEEDTERTYTQITQDEAKEMMAKDDGHVILDVRRQDEYVAGHIPGAILIPNENIGTEQPKELPDLAQIILVYCRTGNRSKQASQKLADMGYTNVYEFGGINDWSGEIVTGESDNEMIWTAREMPVRLRYDRMWEYSYYAETSDPEMIAEIVDAGKALTISEPTDTVVDDYSDILTFSFPDGGMILLEFEEQNWVATDNTRYQVEGLSDLRSLLEDMMNEELADAIRPIPTLVIEANDHIFYADPEDNSSADALIEKLSTGEIELELHDYGSFEKVGPLPWELPRNDESISTVPGDVILYQGNQITIYYDKNTWDFTRLAKIEGVTKEDLLDVFGESDVTVKLWVEWSE